MSHEFKFGDTNEDRSRNICLLKWRGKESEEVDNLPPLLFGGNVATLLIYLQIYLSTYLSNLILIIKQLLLLSVTHSRRIFSR